MPKTRLTQIGAALLILIVIGVLWFTTAQPVQVLPRIRLAPGYALLGADGKPVTSEHRRGQLTLYTFAYTRCGADCRPVFDSLQAIQAELAQQPARSPALSLVVLTVDPTFDTPDLLASTAPAGWRWLTGNEKLMKNVIGGGFEVAYQPQADGSIFFTPGYVLVDGEGVIRAVYAGSRLDARRFRAHLDVLYKEIEQATGPARLAYEAAHFFACYPH